MTNKWDYARFLQPCKSGDLASTSACIKKGGASFFFKLFAVTAGKVFVTVMQIDLICQPVEDFSPLSSMSVCDACYLDCCILD